MNNPKNHLYAVVLAGGSGTRFWPLSRERRPKQFLRMLSRESLFELTLKRLCKKISARHILIVTSGRYRKDVKEQTKKFRVPDQNILWEPQGRNTAPAIAWAAGLIHAKNPAAVMSVFPADHLIAQENNFLKKWDEAVALAQDGYLVTFGIVPARPETGYGYFKTRTVRKRGRAFLAVERFVEKPSLPKAQKFSRSPHYLWNSGMFVFKSAVILEELQKYLPSIYKVFAKRPKSIARIWRKLPNISIDYGILEKSKRVAAVAASDLGWSDVGSWEALAQILASKDRGNALRGDVLEVDCENTLILGGRRLVAAAGLKDMVIVDTPDALLVCPRSSSQKVKDLVGILQKKSRPEC